MKNIVGSLGRGFVEKAKIVANYAKKYSSIIEFSFITGVAMIVLDRLPSWGLLLAGGLTTAVIYKRTPQISDRVEHLALGAAEGCKTLAGYLVTVNPALAQMMPDSEASASAPILNSQEVNKNARRVLANHEPDASENSEHFANTDNIPASRFEKKKF